MITLSNPGTWALYAIAVAHGIGLKIIYDLWKAGRNAKRF